MRTRVRCRRLVVLAAAAASVWLLGGPVAEAVGLGDGPATPSRTHVIRPGETLWSIATRSEPARDPREVVEAIVLANDLDPGALVPGQEILVPAVG
jgi:Tfp pilus assembly protein FimV